MKERIKSGIIDPQIWRALVGILVFLGLWYLLSAVLALPRFKLIPDPVTVFKEWVSFEPVSGRSLFTREYYMDISYIVA